MKIIFSTHARMRFEQRTKINIRAGYGFVKNASTNIEPKYYEYVKKYQEKNTQNDPSITILVYKHWMFVTRISENSIFVITVLVIH